MCNCEPQPYRKLLITSEQYGKNAYVHVKSQNWYTQISINDHSDLFQKRLVLS